MYALQSTKHIAVLQRTRPCIAIEIAGAQYTGESPETLRPTNGANFTAEESDARVVE